MTTFSFRTGVSTQVNSNVLVVMNHELDMPSSFNRCLMFGMEKMFDIILKNNFIRIGHSSLKQFYKDRTQLIGPLFNNRALSNMVSEAYNAWTTNIKIQTLVHACCCTYEWMVNSSQTYKTVKIWVAAFTTAVCESNFRPNQTVTYWSGCHPGKSLFWLPVLEQENHY